MTEEFFIKFGEKIKHYREEKGLTQEALALAINVDKSYIGRIERGERNPNLRVIVDIANELDISVKSLFDF